MDVYEAQNNQSQGVNLSQTLPRRDCESEEIQNSSSEEEEEIEDGRDSSICMSSHPFEQQTATNAGGGGTELYSI